MQQVKKPCLFYEKLYVSSGKTISEIQLNKDLCIHIILICHNIYAKFLFHSRPINEVTPVITNNFDMKTIHYKATEYRRDQRKKDEKNKERRKRRIGFHQNKAQQEVDSGKRLKLNPETFDNQLRRERWVFLIFNQL